jgi:predicted MFS family arabinose efflux permease
VTTMPPARPLSRGLLSLMALATGVIVANLYYLQPLLHEVRGEFRVGTANASLLMTLTQIGYAAGLAFLVPLGDRIRRRRLIVTIFLAAAAAMVLGALLSSFIPFALVTLVIGVSSVGGQIIVPFAADLAEPSQRGRVIARVMTGLLIGILLSRTVSGLIAQVAGWHAVYWAAAALLAAMALVLGRVLPDEPARHDMSYRALVTSVFRLLVTEPQLRRRAWIGTMAFASFSTMWTTLSFHLAAAPLHYSNAVIGLFGLLGVAGVLAANAAGHFADRHHGHRTAIAAAALMTFAYAVLSLGRDDFWTMALGIVILDAGMQGSHITNQSIIYALVPEARSRMNSAYMVCCFTGASLGSYVSGQVYAAFGWTGECWLGAALGVATLAPLLFWQLARDRGALERARRGIAGSRRVRRDRPFERN